MVLRLRHGRDRLFHGLSDLRVFRGLNDQSQSSLYFAHRGQRGGHSLWEQIQ
jgi:hypothetical protein